MAIQKCLFPHFSTMSSKTFILTSSGLKNVIENGNEFSFIFDGRIIQMSNVYAEFLSPAVSHIHQSDPTIESIHILYPKALSNFPTFDNLISDDIITILKKVSSGSMININQEQSKKLRLISIFLDNDELFNTVYTLFSNDNNDKKQEILDNLQYLELSEYFENDMSHVIEYLAREFENIEQEYLLHLSINNLLKIISNEHMIIKKYKNYWDKIIEIIKIHENDDNLNEIFEVLDFDKMNKDVLSKILYCINPNKITVQLWRKIINRILLKSYDIEYENEYLYDGQETNKFKGIIYHLTKQFGGNVHDKGVVCVKASSEDNSANLAKNVVDFDNKENDQNRMRTSDNDKESWIQYDFVDRRVHPTHYTIRSINWDKNDQHLQSWVIEGSNTGNNDWKTIDTQNGVDYINGNGISHTFEIANHDDEKDFYRYLRLRQTGPTKANTNVLTISALEYFGQIQQE